MERITSATAATEATLLVLTKQALQRATQSKTLREEWKHFTTYVLKSHNLVKFCLMRKVPFLANITGNDFVELSELFEYVYFGRKTLVCEEGSQVRATRHAHCVVGV